MKMGQKNKPGWKETAAAAAAIVLSFFLCVSVFAASQTDVCTVTVSLPDDALFADLQPKDVAVDYYRVAGAESTETGGYSFAQWDSAFADEKSMWEEMAAKADTTPLTAEDVNRLTQLLTAKVLSENTVSPCVLPSGKSAGLPGEATEIEPGLYLIIPHGNGLPASRYVVKTGEEYTMIAEGKEKTYHFAPILAAVPMQEEQSDLGSVNISSGTIGISSPASISNEESRGAWNHQVAIIMKAAVETEAPPPDDGGKTGPPDEDKKVTPAPPHTPAVPIDTGDGGDVISILWITAVSGLLLILCAAHFIRSRRAGEKAEKE